MSDKIKAVMIGHAVGDALGVPVEFSSREKVKADPVTDMRGFGIYPYPAGSWSDDTSMSLAEHDSLAKGSVDFEEIMNNFGDWLKTGKYTPTGEAFDAGRTCVKAIINYYAFETKATESGCRDEESNGNGSLMRIHPFALYLYAKNSRNQDVIHTASALTHAHERSRMACGIYSFILWDLLDCPSKDSVVSGIKKAEKFYGKRCESISYSRLFDVDTLRNLDESEIKSSGYVVDTLEAAVWCLLNTDSYKSCVLTAVNLGDDTDTVAAVAGGLAGALYGYDAIPEEWRNTLIKREYIESICEKANDAWK